MKNNSQKEMRVKNIDVLLVALGMIIGFSIIVMHLTHTWPCSILNAYNKQQFNFKTFNYTNSNNYLSLNYFISEIHRLLIGFSLCN